MVVGDKYIDLTVGVKWDDLRSPASSINPVGQASPPTVDTTDGSLVFSKDNVVAMWVQMPHTWKEGTTIHPHLHWMKTSAGVGVPDWQISYKIVPIGELAGTVVGPLSGAEAVSVGSDANRHGVYAFPSIDMTGKRISTMIGIVLRRANTGADTYAGTAKLLEFDIHYQVDTDGSRLPFTK